jgi:HEAT repeat protein
MFTPGTTSAMLDAAEAVATYGEAAVGAVAPLLQSADHQMRWFAAVALTRIGAPAVEALAAAAVDSDFLVRVPAIWALEQVGDPRAVAPLVENLYGMNECCCWMAAAALMKFGGERERSAVETVLADDPAGRKIVEELVQTS